MVALTHKQLNQLRYALKRKFLHNIEASVDSAIAKVLSNEVIHFNDTVNLSLTLRQSISKAEEHSVMLVEA